MTITQLTPLEDNFELWVNLDEITSLVRDKGNAPSSLILTPREPSTTIILKNGQKLSCKETPEQILAKRNAP